MKAHRIILILILFVLMLLISSRVFAHAELLRSNPPVGATLDSSPTEVLTWFSSPLQTGSVLRVIDNQFRDVSRTAAIIDPDDTTLMRLELAPLGPGQYTVNWRATAQDGDISSGSFSFAVREPTIPSAPAILGIVVLFSGLVVSSLVLIARFRKSTNRNY